MFSIDPKTGEKTDAWIHDEITSGLTKEAAEELRQAAYARARKRSLSEEQIRRAYGKPGDPVGLNRSRVNNATVPAHVNRQTPAAPVSCAS
jgi:hypothetical protein